MTAPDSSTVDFHFDLMCPFAYQTSKWIRAVREQIDLTINWKFFSLEEINLRPDQKHPWERDWSYGWSMMRIGALLRRSSMDDLDRWYERAGRALHEEGHRPHDLLRFGKFAEVIGTGYHTKWPMSNSEMLNNVNVSQPRSCPALS